MKPIKRFQSDLRNLPEGKTEGSYYSPFESFLKSHLADITTTAEETAPGKVGFPDITVRHASGEKIGWIEIKTPEEQLSDKKFDDQFKKYKNGLENIIFTNFKDWELWQWKDGEPYKEMAIACNIENFTSENEKQLYKLLKHFKAHSVTEVATTKDLAIALAGKAKLLSEQLLEAYGEEGPEILYEEGRMSPLTTLKKAFQKTLIDKITPRQFANMVAETLTYSLLLAALESEETGEELTLRTAIDLLPKNVPVLRALYDIVLKTSEKVSAIKHAANLIIDQLKIANLSAILKEISERNPSEDAIIYFYEPFLEAYSPEERKSRGVYYTPRAVVDFITHGTDFLLQEFFDKKEGLADKQVRILDPATGTGTFLLSAIECIQQKTMDNFANTNLYEEEFRDIVFEHILRNFYGFELMVAPYAIAHLKLALELRGKGCAINANSRLQIYLANTLDDPRNKTENIFGFNELSEEGEAARKIKKERPILAIIGNPPYANFGMMNKQKWILDLLKDYKKGLGERNANLDDDYIKFIRFAQWKIAGTGKGIFAMITANSFIDGITQRRMREELLKVFDEMYIYNLHGNSRKGETAPDGSLDENVFDIQTGVSINIFIKKNERQSSHCRVFYADAWGSRESKFQKLRKGFKNVKWKEIDHRGFNKAFLSTKWATRLGKLNLFVPSAESEAAKMAEYGEFWGIQDIFQNHKSGIKTHCDHLTIQFKSEACQTIIEDFAELDIEAIRKKYNLGPNGKDWTISGAKQDLNKNKKKIIDIQYRPFDTRKTIYTGEMGFIIRPRTETMRHMLDRNLGLISCRNQSFDTVVSCSTSPIDLRTYSDPGSIGTDYLFPLYVYPENQLKKLTTKCVPNLNTKFINALAEKLGKKPSPEDIFYYTYAVFYCPRYQQRYAEFLKIDFPRLPLTDNKNLFGELTLLGKELVNLHLLGKNPFDSSKTIFNTPNKWKINIGGKAASTGSWEVEKITHDAENNRVYINKAQDRYFEGIDKETWEFMIGGYQPLDKWLKDRKKANRSLSTDDKKHYMKIAVSLRETQRVMQEIDALIPDWEKFVA